MHACTHAHTQAMASATHSGVDEALLCASYHIQKHRMIHVFTHAYIHKHIHTYTQTYIHTNIHRHKDTYIHTNIHRHKDTYIRTNITHTNMHTHRRWHPPPTAKWMKRSCALAIIHVHII